MLQNADGKIFVISTSNNTNANKYVPKNVRKDHMQEDLIQQNLCKRDYISSLSSRQYMNDYTDNLFPTCWSCATR